MSHPHQEHRQSKVEHSRVGKLTRGYASGGAVHSDASEDKALVKGLVKKSALKVSGAKPKHRADRPQRAKGGRVGKTNINIIVAGQGEKPQPQMPPPGPMPAGGPPVPPPPPPAPVPVAPVRGAPGMPPRAHGGRAYKRGGAVKSGPAWEEGRKEGTQVSHVPAKEVTIKNMNRGKPITYARGGPVEAPKAAKPIGLKLKTGAGGGKGRLQKARAYARG